MLERIARVLAIAYSVMIAFVAFWPTPVDRPVAKNVNDIVSAVQSTGASGFSYNTVEVSSNVLMFVPLGFLLVLAIPQWPWWAGVAACLLTSSAIEGIQYLFISDRFASIVDVLANSSGGLLGGLLGWTVSNNSRARVTS